jgi:hypothetical protein
MKISRQYLLGLGSGLILSALIALLFNPVRPVDNTSKESSQAVSSPQADARPSSQEPITSGQDSFSQEKPAEKSGPENSIQAQKSFVIPPGASADKIAQLLQTEGWIQNKADFLTLVKAQKLEKQFVAGTYELTPGLSIENIINQLIK